MKNFGTAIHPSLQPLQPQVKWDQNSKSGWAKIENCQGVCRVWGPIELKSETIESMMKKPFENRLRVSISKINLSLAGLKQKLPKQSILIFLKKNLFYNFLGIW